MCSTELLLWKNQKGSTRYLMTLYKRDFTVDISLRSIKIFFGQGFSQNSSKPPIVKGFYLSECQMIIVFVVLCKGNCRNVIGEILQLF